MAELCMPSLGADMETGTLRAWKIAPGDRVARGQVVGEVETDKGLIDLEIWDEGVVEVLLVAPGTKVPVGTPIARVRSTAARATAAKAVAPVAPVAPAASAPAAAVEARAPAATVAPRG
ncbi:MAG: 2-oxo acid dehydrogenase subunit E2, partial [Myxococcales bacterium]|nr:2-oxo acid dehydrogenase subunit E2 [Myxococcales bacterium]